MARRWLVLVVVLAASHGADAKLEPPMPPDCACPRPVHVPEHLQAFALAPAAPTFAGAEVYVYEGSERVENVSVHGAKFSGDTAFVRIEIDGTSVDTFPDRLTLCDPPLRTRPGVQQLRLIAITAEGYMRASEARQVEVVIDRRQTPDPCGRFHLRDNIGGTLAAVMLGILLLVVVLVVIVVMAVVRMLRAPTGVPEDASPLVAEQLARIVLGSALVVIACGVTGAVLAFAVDVGELSPIPILLIGFGIIDAMVARTALRRLDEPGVTAVLYDRALVLQTPRGSIRLNASRRALSRARKRCLASAHIRRGN